MAANANERDTIDSDVIPEQATPLESKPTTTESPPTHALDYKYAFALDPNRCQPTGSTDRDPLWYLPRIHYKSEQDE